MNIILSVLIKCFIECLRERIHCDWIEWFGWVFCLFFPVCPSSRHDQRERHKIDSIWFLSLRRFENELNSSWKWKKEKQNFNKEKKTKKLNCWLLFGGTKGITTKILIRRGKCQKVFLKWWTFCFSKNYPKYDQHQHQLSLG